MHSLILTRDDVSASGEQDLKDDFPSDLLTFCVSKSSPNMPRYKPCGTNGSLGEYYFAFLNDQLSCSEKNFGVRRRIDVRGAR